MQNMIIIVTLMQNMKNNHVDFWGAIILRVKSLLKLGWLNGCILHQLKYLYLFEIEIEVGLPTLG